MDYLEFKKRVLTTSAQRYNIYFVSAEAAGTFRALVFTGKYLETPFYVDLLKGTLGAEIIPLVVDTVPIFVVVTGTDQMSPTLALFDAASAEANITWVDSTTVLANLLGAQSGVMPMDIHASITITAGAFNSWVTYLDANLLQLSVSALASKHKTKHGSTTIPFFITPNIQADKATAILAEAILPLALEMEAMVLSGNMTNVNSLEFASSFATDVTATNNPVVEFVILSSLLDDMQVLVTKVASLGLASTQHFFGTLTTTMRRRVAKSFKTYPIGVFNLGLSLQLTGLAVLYHYEDVSLSAVSDWSLDRLFLQAT